MPWKECSLMTERMKFVGRLVEGEKMSDLCREFGISRKTGYKIYARFEANGLDGLKDHSKAARNRPNQTDKSMERAIIQVRLEHPTWGAPKIKGYLQKKHGSIVVPARSTIHAILDRNQLIKLRKRPDKNYKSQGTDLISADAPNKLWCTDFKGHFRLANKNYCYPLTVTDQFSRYLLACEALENNQEDPCIEVFDQLFEKYGLPEAIRSDNGVPFASRSYFGLSRLSVYWLRLGIKLERIEPGHPEQNGRHERMHRTLKAEATNPPGSNMLSQQEKFDSFQEIFNNQRPHQAIDMKTPSEIYLPSKTKYKTILEPLDYPSSDHTLTVTRCGSININKTRIYLGTPFSGYNVGIQQIEDGLWKVSFMNYDLGFFDKDSTQIQAGTNPFLIKTE